MLRMLAEPDFLPEWLARQTDSEAAAALVRCGPPDALRPCRADEPALAQMARVCARGGEPTVARVAQQSGCAVSSGVWLPHKMDSRRCHPFRFQRPLGPSFSDTPCHNHNRLGSLNSIFFR